MSFLFKPAYQKRDRRTGKKISKKLKCWYIQYKDAQGIWRRVKGLTDKVATQQKAAELEKAVAREIVGITDPYAKYRKEPLREQLIEFRKFLIHKGDCMAHVQATEVIVLRMLKSCKSSLVADLSATRVQEWLNREKRRGISRRTCNQYLIAVKSFARWLVREGRMSTSPLDHLGTINAKVDVRRERRVLSVEELGRLINAARGSHEFLGISGNDRAMLYLVAAYTGLRAGELASLMPQSFSLEGSPPTVTVQAASSKHRKKDVLPLRADLVEELHAWLVGKPQDKLLWLPKSLQQGARMIREDLASAQIPYIDQGGKVFDFHALRHWYISLLAVGGCHPKTLQTLARHATVTLTLERYAHVELSHTAEALKALPGLPARLVGANAPKESAGGGAEPHVQAHVHGHVENPVTGGPARAVDGNVEPSQVHQASSVGKTVEEPGNGGETITTRRADRANSLSTSPLSRCQIQARAGATHREAAESPDRDFARCCRVARSPLRSLALRSPRRSGFSGPARQIPRRRAITSS
jgi:integrase